MNLEVECRTAAEAAAAIRDGDIPLLVASMRLEVSVSARIKCMAGVVTLVALGGAQIRAESWGTSTLNAESWGTSTIKAESRETSTLSAESRETSTLNAESRETSTLNAESRETSTLNAESWETSTLNAEARGYARICLRGSAQAADSCSAWSSTQRRLGATTTASQSRPSTPSYSRASTRTSSRSGEGFATSLAQHPSVTTGIRSANAAAACIFRRPRVTRWSSTILPDAVSSRAVSRSPISSYTQTGNTRINARLLA